jgi:hypothetical protein
LLVSYCFVDRLSRIDSLKTKIFTLGCTQRRSVFLDHASGISCLYSLLSSAIASTMHKVTKSQVYTFSRSALKHLKTERVKIFDYCMPCKLNWPYNLELCVLDLVILDNLTI